MDGKLFVPYYWNGLLTFICLGTSVLLLGRFISPSKQAKKWKEALVRSSPIKISPFFMGIIWFFLYAMEVGAGYLAWQTMVTLRIDPATGDISVVDLDGVFTNTQALYLTFGLSFWLGNLFLNTFYDPLMTARKSKWLGFGILLLAFAADGVKAGFFYYTSWKIGLIGTFMPVMQVIVLINILWAVDPSK